VTGSVTIKNKQRTSTSEMSAAVRAFWHARPGRHNLAQSGLIPSANFLGNSRFREQRDRAEISA